ncbi:MFS transporter [Granulibacter bethesdensis]|uniref:Transporter, MFS superfamily n=1 Tax=Granulibacter bethesdensis (strain ATCC BAA-1260 / CGDNIH1) TaxID=391165 RepID=Q0BQ34_GRABC|nr:MFS transporter [Granulibacter bethesdensis]ABI63068.1 Transporter, MFS superfamily [Granulibacter bethesdensis CGDNIH1]AHJ67965.1 Transporter, MFS superfamily [Granulibacter bethesdensis]APH52941.1 Transporter, MFS superfamily [Granulibacter bethesdensis]APH65629.1 Transporter, MFS superfamily [Granulibacter bethesdensis]
MSKDSHSPQFATSSSQHPPSETPDGVSPWIQWVLSVCVACTVGAIYYNQPMLGAISVQFPGHPVAIGMIPTATQLGYALGLLLLVPLGDMLPRRGLILIQTLAAALALILAGMVQSAAGLAAVSVLVGLGASVTQQIVPLAAALAAPSRRGAAVGMVMSGLFCGILLSRTLSGWVTDMVGWRAAFGAGAVLDLLAAVALAIMLPSLPPVTRTRYGALLLSLGTLWRQEPVLRHATFIQIGQFAAFSIFWSILALRLEQPPFELGAGAAGLFGILGIAGILIAPVTGRLADRRGPELMIGLGLILVLASWGVFCAVPGIAGLAAGVVLLDLGVQATQISNQHRIYALRPDARARINTIYMGLMFLGGAAGSMLASLVWHQGGWTPLCLLGATVTVLAISVHVTATRQQSRP